MRNGIPPHSGNCTAGELSAFLTDRSPQSVNMRYQEHVPRKGVKSTTAGCLPLAVPFALAFPDMNEACERAVRACNVTHTHPAAHAAVSTFVTLLYHTLHGSPDPVGKALAKAQVEDEVLGGKIRNALALEKDGMETETALLKIGNDVSVFQTVPIAFFLISRYTHPAGSPHGLREHRRKYRHHRLPLRGISWRTGRHRCTPGRPACRP